MLKPVSLYWLNRIYVWKRTSNDDNSLEWNRQFHSSACVLIHSSEFGRDGRGAPAVLRPHLILLNPAQSHIIFINPRLTPLNPLSLPL